MKTPSHKPIAITPGEPGGIGFDIVLSAITQQDFPAPLVIIADKKALHARAKILNLSVDLAEYNANQPKPISIIDVPLLHPVIAGQANPNYAPQLLKTLDIASDYCCRGEFCGLVTGPIHKASINEAGVDFSGHTEYLAQITQTPMPVMLMASPLLKVALLTTHIPLRAASELITMQRIQQVIGVLQHGLQQYFHIPTPRIQLCGLNPHAGENGHLGREEIEVIIPTVKTLQQQGVNISLPVPADTAFIAKNRQHFDVTLALYHDQGLPVIKALQFNQVVNVTLGLPYLRCSVDHGTALDLAGSGEADHQSLLHAIQLLIQSSHHA